MQIKRLTAELALEAAHLLLAGQRSDPSATSISALTTDNNRQREENAYFEQRVALLTGQLAQKTEEVETVSVRNTPDCVLTSPSSQSPCSILRISISLYRGKNVLEMDPSEIHTNLRLKREVLRLATRISAASAGATVTDYALIRGELDPLSYWRIWNFLGRIRC